VPREREYVFHPMLQLSVGRRGKTLSRKLSGLQTHEGGDAEEEVASGCLIFKKLGRKQKS
jgi:hypothetical protein